ncbi:class I SAM-dependent DNA methyltransferase [Gymnodinialimonas ceratoperidinii]|uniref:Class I SAM-dependent methyltransferase n=1 Tax=Gymnodinialimonas ceratoperidinii TaxID=2856823 RepID=A0A8F6YB55_9RHOB|nr:class I SAM-dependent methyltransferase [Gymnodinialimonas ceratoperidinii]QXT39726.1 class I SAM-dependent methyltransferase [Gymnodinialimonas ceratoperidinii]
MSDDKTISVYETRAESYAGMGITPTQAEALEVFTAALPAAADILDLGCGPGLHARAMMELGHRVDGIDATPAFVDAAVSRGVSAQLGTFDDITAHDAYDGIWASFSLLHAPRAEVPRHLRALAHALRPGGVLFLGMKTGEGEARDGLGRHYSYFTAEELIAMLTGLGLTLTHRVDGAEPGLAGTHDPFTLLHAKAPDDA